MVLWCNDSTSDCESGDPSSTLGRTFVLHFPGTSGYITDGDILVFLPALEIHASKNQSIYHIHFGYSLEHNFYT